MDQDKHVSFANGKAYGTFSDSSSSSSTSKAQKEEDSSEKKPNIVELPFQIDRLAMTQSKLNFVSPPFQREEDTLHQKVHSVFKNNFAVSCACLAENLKKVFPILRWLPQYSVKNDLLIDVITGFTLLILHVPQGMAYAQLASVPPIYGLYTSFYPVLIYVFLGTSKHISVGTFAISSLLTGTSVLSVTNMEFLNKKAQMDHVPVANDNSTNTTLLMMVPGQSEVILHTNIQVAMILTFTVGILQTGMGLLRMGALTSFMSDEMVSAFITGTVIHVFTSQLKPLTGAVFPVHSGPFNIILTWIEMFRNIRSASYIVILISLCSLTFLILVKEILNVCLLKKTRIPIPAELILVIIGTLVSYFYSLNMCCGVDIVGHIPTGFMPPTYPPFELLPKVLTSSMVLAIVCATTTLSMVIIYSKKHEYEVDTNQELLAYGIGGVVSSFFFCIPSCGSLSRSAVQETTGAKSQVAGLISCILMLVVLLALGPLFESLPSCILSAVIVMSLKSMLMHFGDFRRAWNTSKLDASVWMVTFLSVVLLDMDYGLIIGILFALVTIIFRSQYPETSLLGNLPGTELYRSADKYPNVAEIPGIKIFHFGASLYFGNRDYFRSQLFHHVSSLQSISALGDAQYQAGSEEKRKSIDPEDQLSFSKSYKGEDLLKVIIIDLSAVAYIDSGAVATLLQVIREFAVNQIAIRLACVQEPVLESLKNQGFFKTFSEDYIFPTINDAVLYAQQYIRSS